jgi:chaperonin GroES
MLEVSIGTKERHTMKVRPLYTRVLVRRVEPKKSEVNGAIILPEMAREESMEAKIIAVGGGKRDRTGKRIPLQVRVGDRVLVRKDSGEEVMLEDIQHLILKEDEILGIIG